MAWKLRNTNPALFGGLSLLRLRLVGTRLMLLVKAKDADLSGANDDHVAMSLRIGSVGTADCWGALFTGCAGGGDGTLVCR
jgi:hypothetical protein